MARVPGTVKSIPKDIGDTVTENEVLVELDAPDLVQELAQKKAAVLGAQQDLKAAQVALLVAQASAKSALALVKETQRPRRVPRRSSNSTKTNSLATNC